jgi:hypothetical protein
MIRLQGDKMLVLLVSADTPLNVEVFAGNINNHRCQRFGSISLLVYHERSTGIRVDVSDERPCARGKIGYCICRNEFLFCSEAWVPGIGMRRGSWPSREERRSGGKST